MRLITVAVMLVLANTIAADFEEYKQAILKFTEMGIENDPYYTVSRSAESRALPFPCSPIPASSSVPTSVHRLTPGDIKIVGAIGDSLTAANGAKASTLLGLLTEYRGISWCMGGDADSSTVTTIPNLLKRYNPTIRGFSVGTGSYTSTGASFNVAQPGHTSHDMLAQAQLLVNRIKADTRVNFNEDWKLINFFVGGNDLCKFCKDEAKYVPDNYVGNIRNTLDFFKANLPRALINLVLTLDVKGIELMNVGYVCKTMHNYLCECGITLANADKINALVTNYQAMTEQLIASGRYDNNDQFTVVLQPFMKEMKPPLLANGNPDYSYFAPDCFHFSQKGHETAALELWNNMMQPVGAKSTEWTAFVSKVECPSASKPYIFTNQNSGSSLLKNLTN
jgi:phospholipase B1, membrane-associated